MAKREITQEYLRSLFHYDPETGVLTWKERPREHFVSNRGWNTWNVKNAGRRAGADCGPNYWRVSVDKRRYLLHRVIWMLVHGSWPVVIDHLNGDRGDNRISNLRNTTKAENNKNRAMDTRNTSGVAGVSWNKRLSKWQSKLSRRHLGFFEAKEAAIRARKAAESVHGYRC